MGAVDIPVDEWGIDVCFTGSQKALMLPPGLAIISVGERAWARMADSGMKRFYLNLATAQEFLDIGQTPFTPALSQMVAMKKSLELYFSEGRERCYARHRRMAGATRAAMRALGLELLVGEKEASLTVTAVKKPEEIDISRLRAVMREDFGVEIAGGREAPGKIFRLGPPGAVTEMDVIVAIAALEMALARLNYPVSLGQGVKAAQEVILAG